MVLAVNANCTCPICHLFFLDTVLLSCGHAFCDFCARSWLQHVWSCPLCGLRTTAPATRRLWAIDNFLSDFTEGLKEVGGGEWAEDGLPAVHEDLDWSEPILRTLLHQQPERSLLLDPKTRLSLNIRRRAFLEENWEGEAGLRRRTAWAWIWKHLPTLNQLSLSLLATLLLLLVSPSAPHPSPPTHRLVKNQVVLA